MRFNILDILNVEGLIKPSVAVAAGLGALMTPILNTLYGEQNLILFYLLIILMVLDWISGIAASQKEGVYSSLYGINGVLRSVFLLCLPIAGNYMDLVIGTSGVIFYAITLGLCYHMWKSMTANSYCAGWERWIPQKVVDYVSSEIEAKLERVIKIKAEKHSVHKHNHKES